MHHVTAPVIGIVMLYSGGALFAPDAVSSLFDVLEIRAAEQVADNAYASKQTTLARVD